MVKGWHESTAYSLHCVASLLLGRGFRSLNFSWRGQQVVADYNADKNVHGILVQLPLPKHINEQRILDGISLEKDVDGFHPANIGALAMRGRQPLFTSCTPKVTPRTMCSSPCAALVCVMEGHFGQGATLAPDEVPPNPMSDSAHCHSGRG